MGHSLVSKFFLPLNPQPATVSCGWRASRSADCLTGLCCPVQSCGLEARGRARKLEGLRFRARLSPHCPSLVVSGSPQRPPQTAEMGRWAGDACGTCIHPWSPGAQRLLQSSALLETSCDPGACPSRARGGWPAPHPSCSSGRTGNILSCSGLARPHALVQTCNVC